MRTGIVLGAGGPFGWAYHLGVVEGVREAIGQEPARADRILGTSAGGAIAASLLAGGTTADVLEVASAPPTDEERERMLRTLRARLRSNPLRSLRPVAPRLATKVHRVGVATASAGLLPAGVFPTFPLRKFAAGAFRDWPQQLWVPSVRLDDGQTVFFGRDRRDVSVLDAIEATSAVPGLFRPKRIDGSCYVDGAVASATHAASLADQGLDLVLVSLPMARPGAGLNRHRARRQLVAERAVLSKAAVHTLVLTPTRAILGLADGYPRRRPEAGADIVDAARAQTVAAFASLDARRSRSEVSI